MLVSATMMMSSFALAQDAPTWESLFQERVNSFGRLQELQQSFRGATPEEQQKYAKEYMATVTKLRETILPGLGKQLDAKLTADPKDEQALEIGTELMQIGFSSNNYSECLKTAETVLKHDKENKLATNMLGVCKFADHDFAGAVEVLSKADDAGALMPELGGRYLSTAKAYVDYWKTEQEIRKKEDAAEGDAALPRVEITTSRGKIVLELFENEAPNTVANFVSLVDSKFYDGLAFHRVLPNFMAQGGCPNSKKGSTMPAGSGGPGYNIKCEAYAENARRHFAGSISMAHAGRDTGGSQFFITHLPTPHLDREINPQSVHTVFGRVIEGLDTLRAVQPNDVIESAKVLRKRNHEYKPETQPE